MLARISDFFFIWRNSPQWAMASSFTRFLEHTQRRTAVSTTPLDEWSARRRDLYLKTHNTHNSKHPCPRWDSNPQSQQTADVHLRPRGHWDRLISGVTHTKKKINKAQTNCVLTIVLFIFVCGDTLKKTRRSIWHPTQFWWLSNHS